MDHLSVQFEKTEKIFLKNENMIVHIIVTGQILNRNATCQKDHEITRMSYSTNHIENEYSDNVEN